jgi:hypothetical protein
MPYGIITLTHPYNKKSNRLKLAALVGYSLNNFVYLLG